jgi:tetratricopeptide (TPR) repeat protein
MDDLRFALRRYISDTKNPLYNFDLGYEYEKIYQTASAVAYYSRVLEYSRDDLLTYEALLRISSCFTFQGSLKGHVVNALMKAVAIMPDRPEAYYLLSKAYYDVRTWQESYTFAALGQKAHKDNHIPLRTEVGYFGEYVLEFQRAVAAWHTGRFDESFHLFRKINRMPVIDLDHKNATRNNLKNMERKQSRPKLYSYRDYESFKYKFSGIEMVRTNYSQAFQDMFVLTMLNGKRDGSFLDIGASDPYFNNNTALLEKFGWRGESFEINKDYKADFDYNRICKLTIADATKVDFSNLSGHIDYLSLDIEPPEATLQMLLKLPLEKVSFGVITFEHDYYLNNDSLVRERSREYLKSHGYRLVLSDVSINKFNSFEDWWVHPSVVNTKNISIIYDLEKYTGPINWIEPIMFN